MEFPAIFFVKVNVVDSLKRLEQDKNFGTSKAKSQGWGIVKSFFKIERK